MNKNTLIGIIVALAVIITAVLIYFFIIKKTSTITTSTSSSTSPTTPPTSTPSTSTPSTSPQPIQVIDFVVTNGCTGNYQWAMITFVSQVSGTLSQIQLFNANGVTGSIWDGNLQITAGQPTTIWLHDTPPYEHLTCNNPNGQIAGITFVISGTQYGVLVTPTIGNPLATYPLSNQYVFNYYERIASFEVTSVVLASPCNASSCSCVGSECYAQITFTSGISGTLTQVLTLYPLKSNQNGLASAWCGSLNVQAGQPVTIWLQDTAPCNHLVCNNPSAPYGQLQSLSLTIGGTAVSFAPLPISYGNPTPPSGTPPANIFKLCTI